MNITTHHSLLHIAYHGRLTSLAVTVEAVCSFERLVRDSKPHGITSQQVVVITHVNSFKRWLWCLQIEGPYVCYVQMVAVDPSAPSSEEHRNKAVTKLRYMQFREQQSSTCSQGFRVEAMKVSGKAVC